MTPEQAVIKAGGAELPLLALDHPGFWVLCLFAAGMFVYWINRRKP